MQKKNKLVFLFLPSFINKLQINDTYWYMIIHLMLKHEYLWNYSFYLFKDKIIQT